MTRAKNVWLDGNYATTTKRPTTQSSSTASTASTATTATTATTVTTATQGGPCVHGQYYPIANSCQDYNQCLQGNLITSTCPSGLFWDTNANGCNWESAVDCCDGNRPCNV